jgi:hypothetical protein
VHEWSTVVGIEPKTKVKISLELLCARLFGFGGFEYVNLEPWVHGWVGRLVA